MKIIMKKFGTTLISRPAGKEAYLAFQPTLMEVKKNEFIEVDFGEVLVLGPSWADEFITPLLKQYHGKVRLLNTENPSVKATIELLQNMKSAN